MAHHLYTTEGFILKSRPAGDADKYLYIFTRDFGLVVAKARSVRNIYSKLSANLTDLSRASVSLVKGKRSWRIVGSDVSLNIYASLRRMPEKVLLWAQFLNLILHLVNGEERDARLFSLLEDYHNLISTRNFAPDEITAAETLAGYLLLRELGNARDREEYNSLIRKPLFSEDSIRDAKRLSGMLVSDINEALAGSKS